MCAFAFSKAFGRVEVVQSAPDTDTDTIRTDPAAAGGTDIRRGRGRETLSCFGRGRTVSERKIALHSATLRRYATQSQFARTMGQGELHSLLPSSTASSASPPRPLHHLPLPHRPRPTTPTPVEPASHHWSLLPHSSRPTCHTLDTTASTSYALALLDEIATPASILWDPRYIVRQRPAASPPYYTFPPSPAAKTLVHSLPSTISVQNLDHEEPTADMDKRHPSSFQQLEKLGEGTYATVRMGLGSVSRLPYMLATLALAHPPWLC